MAMREHRVCPTAQDARCGVGRIKGHGISLPFFGLVV
jgi:hypothetical protein